MKVNLKSCTGFTGHREVGDWSDCTFSLVQYLVFLYRALGRHWSVEAYHAPRGNTGAWALEETLFRVCEFKNLHNCCAITRICAGGLTACFPPWPPCASCLFYGVIWWRFQRYRNPGATEHSLSLVDCSALSFVVFPTNPPHWLLKKSRRFKASSLLLVLTRCLQVHRVRARRSFLTNFALSLHSPWHTCCRYKPASADNAPDRNAPSIPNKQDAQPWGEQELQLVHRL